MVVDQSKFLDLKPLQQKHTMLNVNIHPKVLELLKKLPANVTFHYKFDGKDHEVPKENISAFLNNKFKVDAKQPDFSGIEKQYLVGFFNSPKVLQKFVSLTPGKLYNLDLGLVVLHQSPFKEHEDAAPAPKKEKASVSAGTRPDVLQAVSSPAIGAEKPYELSKDLVVALLTKIKGPFGEILGSTGENK